MSVHRQSQVSELAPPPIAMPKVLVDVPPGYDWGWYSAEDPRMHLQTVDRKHRNLHKVWLETGGTRTIEAATPIPAKVLKALQSAVQRNRRTIEDYWVELMIHQRWLEAHLKAPKVTLVAYPSTAGRFTREIDLSDYVLPEEARKLQFADIALSADMSSLQIWPSRPEARRPDIRLSTLLWRD